MRPEDLPTSPDEPGRRDKFHHGARVSKIRGPRECDLPVRRLACPVVVVNLDSARGSSKALPQGLGGTGTKPLSVFRLFYSVFLCLWGKACVAKLQPIRGFWRARAATYLISRAVTISGLST
jgi:hypothetical protein